jgi:hypothetical protein
MLRNLSPLFLLFAAGCFGDYDSKAPKLQPVTGVVKLDGNPMKNADLMFLPKTGDLEAGGRSDADGKYELYVRDKKGAVAGSYKVTISKRVRDDGSEFPEDRSAMGIGKETLPPKFVDRTRTELTAEVKEGSNEINFDLKLK